MNEQSVLTPTDLLHSLQLIRSGDPSDRRSGIEGLSQLGDDPRVVQVFEHLYENDSDPGVRDAAWRAINRAGPSIPAPGPAVSPNPPAAAPRRADRPVRRAAPARPAPTTRTVPSASLFLLEQSNARLVARHMRRSRSSPRGGRVITILAGLMLLFIGVLGGLVLPDWIAWVRLRQGGVAVQGEVVEVQAHGDHYSALYRFPVAEGDFYTGEQSLEARDRLAENSPVQVLYLPDDPDISRLEDESNPDDARRDRFTIGLALLVVGLVVLAILAGVRRGGTARHKCVIRGQVISCSGYRDGDGDYNLKLRYRFRSPSGQRITGQISQIRNDLAGADLPGPGTPVAVYYRSERSHLLL